MVKIHQVAELFPMLSAPELNEMAESIRKDGLINPCVCQGDVLLDGRNRLAACEIAGVEPRFIEYTGDDVAAYIVAQNIHRRHLNESQRAMVASRLATLKQGGDSGVYDKDKTNGPIGLLIPQSQAADMLNVGGRSVKRARVVIEQGAPELVKAVDNGEVAVSTAAIISSLPEEEQKDVVAKGRDQILEVARAIRREEREARIESNKLLKNSSPARIDANGKYSVIVIDPPWDIEKIERDERPNQSAFDYPTMTEQELSSFGVGEIADDDCHLFCWTTQRFLQTALRLLDTWGFRYVCTFVWHKAGGFQPVGLPQYNCEFVLYGRKGSPKFIDTKQFFTCFEAQRREHSRKPDTFYDTVARVTSGHRIDVFSREKREGFDAFGNEANKFSE